MSALPLTIRKNIRDAEPKLKENLEKINQATGKEWICEVDFASNVAQIDGYGKDTIGNLYYDEVLGNLAQNITNLCKTETSKEAFNEATSANKIVIKVDEKAKDYWIISISNGELVLTHKKQIANTSNVSYFDLVSVIPTPGIPLVAKLNIEENQPKLEEHLQTIAEATGVSDWTLEVDFAGIVPKLEEYYQKNVGNIYYNEMLGAFANNVRKTMKNEILKEAFLEATSERKIISYYSKEIQLNDKIKDYNQISFLNGTVIISHKKSIANVNQIEYTDLAPIIPVPGLPLVAKLNLAENEEKLQANLERINAATGSSGWSLEVDIPAVLPQLGQYEQNRIGSIYYDEVMDNLSRLLENKMKVETIKEAFNEAASNQKIVVRVNDKAKDYWDIKFENGNVVVEHKKSIANISNVGYFPLEKVIPTPGLTLVVKLNIEEYQPKFTEALDKINQATGEQDWTVEIDYEKILPQLDEYSRNNIGSIYSEALNNLGDNLIRKLASETIKEAFNEATSEKKVIISVGDAKQSNYWDIKFQNGNLLLTHKKQIANLNEVSYYEIQKIIPVPGVLSLVSKLNIEEYQEKKEEHLQVIKEATGSEDYTFDDAVLETVYPKLGDYEKNRIGDIFLNEALGNLASNLKKALADEMVKEAFCEVSTSHLITIQHDPKQSNYWTISFKDGNIVLSFKQIANMNEIQYFDIEKIL